jgi:riboflavin biosynthesis pyrimidine reductase
MRRLWPEPGEVDDVAALVASEPRDPAPDRPWLLVNMVASLDGGVTVEGRSGGLAGKADKELFGALRQIADVVLAGAGTMRAEDYGPPKATDEVRALRQARGQREVPRIAVVTRRLDLDPTARLFSDPDNRPWVITHTLPPLTDAPPSTRWLTSSRSATTTLILWQRWRSCGPKGARWSPARADPR